MRLYRVLLTPWVATPRFSRWLLVFMLALLVLGDALGQIFGVATRVWVFSACMLGAANAMCWLLLLPNGLLLAMAARHLRLPGIRRDVVWSLLLYAALGIGVPMLCQFPHGHMLGFAIVQVLVVVGTMLYLVLPAYVGLALCLLPVLFNSARHAFSLPGLTDPRFLSWGGTTAVLLVLLLAWRWRHLLRGDYAEWGMRAPNLINLRRNMGGAQRDPLTDAGLLRARPNWMLAHPDLRRVGPQAPVRSLRVALGGASLPQTIIGCLYQWVSVMLMVVLAGLVLLVTTLDDHRLSHVLYYVFSREGFVAASWVFAVCGLALVMTPVELLTLRWGRRNAELPLLALLPGLGQAGRSTCVLLRTVIERPAVRLGLLLLVGWLGTASLDVGWTVALAMLVVTLGCLGYVYAMALSLFGGCPLPNFGKSLLMIGMFVLVSVTVLLPQLWHDWDMLYAARARDALVAAWLALALFLSWLGVHGWRELRQRPHPFLTR